MLIHVNKEDILAGIPMSSCRCPIALAITRELDARDVNVGDIFVSINGSRIIPLPHVAQDFIKKFDSDHLSGRLMEEFSFELEVPDENRD